MSALQLRQAAFGLVAVLGIGSPVALLAVDLPAAVISQKNRLFAPTELTIPIGGTVRLTNDDPFLHQIFVSSPTFSFDSDGQSPGQSIDVPFPTAGDFRVLCGIHPKMSLTVHVR